MTSEKKKVSKRARFAPDLMKKKLQVGKGPMLEMQSKLWKKKRKGLKQPKAKPSLKDQKKLVKKASESISHKIVSKDSK